MLVKLTCDSCQSMPCCRLVCYAVRYRAMQAEKELVSEIAGGQGQAKNLAARQKALDEQLLRQGELMYAVDFGLQVGGCSTQ